MPVACMSVNTCRHSFWSLPPSCVAQPGVCKSEASTDRTLSCWAKAVKWLVISSALVSHPMSCPSSRIRMYGLYRCITGISWGMKLLIVLPPSPNIYTRAVSVDLKEGCILASLYVNSVASAYRWNDHKWLQREPYWQYYSTEEWN